MSWVGFFIAFPFFILFAIFGTVVYLLYLNKKEKGEPENNPLVTSRMKAYTGGYAWLYCAEKITGVERTRFILYPRDVNPSKLVNQSKKSGKDIVIKPIIIHVRNDLIDNSLSSDHRIHLTIYPPRPEDISADLKGTTEGKIIEERIAKANTVRDSEMINRSEAENLRSMAMDTKGLNIYKTILNLKGAELKELISSNPNQSPQPSK